MPKASWVIDVVTTRSWSVKIANDLSAGTTPLLKLITSSIHVILSLTCGLFRYSSSWYASRDCSWSRKIIPEPSGYKSANAGLTRNLSSNSG